MKKFLLLLSFVFLMTQCVLAVNYYSGGNNAPNVTANWWTNTDGTGSHPSNFTAAGNAFIIQAGHTMTTTANWTVSGTGSSVQINGTLVASNTVTIPSASVVNSGGTYQHNINGGTIPTPTWNANSTCLITGTTTTLPTTATTTFGNFIWNCPEQNLASAAALQGTLTFNNLTVINTGSNATTGQLRIQATPITVHGDVSINGGTMWVAGQAAKIMNVDGNVSINGGTLDLMGYTGANSGTLNIKGNLSVATGTLQVSGASTNSGIVFNGSGVQTFTSGGTITGIVNFTVNNGSTLQMADASTVVSGSGAFTLSSGATLGITSADGISSSGATGNIQVTGTRAFNTGANYIYNGTTMQITGSGLPATVQNLTINNSSLVGVFLSQATTVDDTLALTLGILDNSTNPVTLGPSGILVQTGGSLVAPLPVELISFTAVLQGTGAVLQWSTATETNNAGFQIERSLEGSGVWIQVAFVNGAGTSSTQKSYSYEDLNLAPGAYIYRLKQIDNDGTATIYNPLALPKVDAGVSQTLQLCSNYPNPFNPSTEIRFSVPQDGYASLKVYNMLGQEVAKLFDGFAKTGHYISATFDASRLASGVYFSRLQYNGKSLVQRMLLTR